MHQTYTAAFEENMLMQDFSMTKGSAHSFGSFSESIPRIQDIELGMKTKVKYIRFQLVKE